MVPTYRFADLKSTKTNGEREMRDERQGTLNKFNLYTDIRQWLDKKQRQKVASRVRTNTFTINI
jgi:hypothetical protein